MKISKLNSIPETFCSMDASTNSVAYAIFRDGNLESYGKIDFSGADIYLKIYSAAKKVYETFKDKSIGGMVIERAVFINSPKTMSELSMVQGAIIAGFAMAGTSKFKGINPIAWQTSIGNGKLTKEEKLKIRKENPGKSDSWYKAFERDVRKNKTISFVEVNYDVSLTDNDIADAIGIGHYAINNWNRMEG